MNKAVQKESKLAEETLNYVLSIQDTYMEVTKRRFKYSEWSFEKIYTFNPFYFPQYIGRNGSVNSYYSNLEPKARKYFDFKLYLGL